MGVTLLEISLDDAEITANAPFSGAGASGSSGPPSTAESTSREDAEEIEIGDGETTTGRSGGGPLILPLLALAALFALAVLARRAMSSGSDADEV